MKALRIILLILIIVGVAALVTQRLWVPKLVAYILSREQSPVPAVTVQAPIQLSDGRQCYTYTHEATQDAPYTVHEFLDITINGTSVTGTKTGTQEGPDMTNGYRGSFVGTLNNNMIRGIFSATIEGAANKEEEIYKATTTGVEKLRYPLTEKGGIHVPDETQSPTALRYARVECTGSN
ncbi:MAG TPA: hypothetical protein VG982_02680 [Candidatus Paceibacterota bacterium]|nr:hypothetical protein [Candidatus Paceibacterota bacterium]